MNASSKTNTRSPHHFLFMLPDSATPAEQDHVVEAAKELTSMGYVYVASAQERTMEDRDNIRFMPLRPDDLPRFGAVSGVMVVRDQSMAQAAQEAYPGAKVFVIDPAQASQKPRHRAAALTVWPQPLMAASSAPHAA